MRVVTTTILILCFVSGAHVAALAWGALGHRLINGDAARALPASVPPFVRTPVAVAEITLLGPEADRLKGAGNAYDADLDPAHFVDVDDDGTVLGVVPLAQLPPTREAYDTALRAGHPDKGRGDQFTAGYLPYAIIEGEQQVEMDFAIWRIDTYEEAHAATAAARAAFLGDRLLREILTERDIGYWGHFIGDGSQPLHVTVHFNGWGDYPNPNGYSQSHTIHSFFETAFVGANATPALLQPRIGAYVPSTQAYATRVSAYLQTTASAVPTVYQLDRSGAFSAATPAAVNFMLDRLAAGAQMLRDSIADAYAASDDDVVYPNERVRDVENGIIIPQIPATPQ